MFTVLVKAGKLHVSAVFFSIFCTSEQANVFPILFVYFEFLCE